MTPSSLLFTANPSTYSTNSTSKHILTLSPSSQPTAPSLKWAAIIFLLSNGNSLHCSCFPSHSATIHFHRTDRMILSKYVVFCNSSAENFPSAPIVLRMKSKLLALVPHHPGSSLCSSLYLHLDSLFLKVLTTKLLSLRPVHFFRQDELIAYCCYLFLRLTGSWCWDL